MVLSDTVFWYAFFSPKDKYHPHSLAVIQRLNEGLITTWPVITETCSLLGKALGSKSQLRFLQALDANYVEVFQIQPKHLPHIQQLMQKYADLLMDLADASLVILAEELGHGRMLSTDQRNLKPFAGTIRNHSKISYCRNNHVTAAKTDCHERTRLSGVCVPHTRGFRIV